MIVSLRYKLIVQILDRAITVNYRLCLQQGVLLLSTFLQCGSTFACLLVISKKIHFWKVIICVINPYSVLLMLPQIFARIRLKHYQLHTQFSHFQNNPHVYQDPRWMYWSSEFQVTDIISYTCSSIAFQTRKFASWFTVCSTCIQYPLFTCYFAGVGKSSFIKTAIYLFKKFFAPIDVTLYFFLFNNVLILHLAFCR